MRAAAAILSFLPTALSFATTKSSVSYRASSNLMAKLGDSIDFAKYEGLGNDFILIDDRDKSDPSLTPEQSERLCNRNFGIGGDGVIFALKAPEGKTSISCVMMSSVVCIMFHLTSTNTSHHKTTSNYNTRQSKLNS